MARQFRIQHKKKLIAGTGNLLRQLNLTDIQYYIIPSFVRHQQQPTSN